MKLNNSVSFPQFMDEMWVIFFIIFKGVAQSVVGLFYFVTLFLFFFFQWIFMGVGWLYSLVTEWEPVRPAIFEVGGD